MENGSLEGERKSAAGVSGVGDDGVVEMLRDGLWLLLSDIAERRDGKCRRREVAGGSDVMNGSCWLFDHRWAWAEGGGGRGGTADRATRMSRSDGLGCGQRNGRVSVDWKVSAGSFESLAGGVLDGLELAGLVDVAVLASDVAQVVAGLHFEGAVGGLESVSVGSVVIDSVNLLQDRHRSRRLLPIGVGSGYQQDGNNQHHLWIETNSINGIISDN